MGQLFKDAVAKSKLMATQPTPHNCSRATPTSPAVHVNGLTSIDCGIDVVEDRLHLYSGRNTEVANRVSGDSHAARHQFVGIRSKGDAEGRLCRLHQIDDVTNPGVKQSSKLGRG
jgi:hypothetical protein